MIVIRPNRAAEEWALQSGTHIVLMRSNVDHKAF